jgi:hypothetical protein
VEEVKAKPCPYLEAKDTENFTVYWRTDATQSRPYLRGSHEKGAKEGSGKLAIQSRPYLRKVVADRGWQLGQHAGLTLPKEEGQHVVLTLP